MRKELGWVRVQETVNGGRTHVQRMYENAASFDEATDAVHAWLWLTQSQAMALYVMKSWMRGESYADHSVNVRYYVPGTVGHWFNVTYCA